MFNEFDNLSKSNLLKLLAIVVMSDGTLRTKKPGYIRLTTANKSNCQHELFDFLCFSVFNKHPNKCIVHANKINGNFDTFIQSTLVLGEDINKFLKLSPSFKTTSGRLSKEEFLNCPQPSAKFLFGSPQRIKWLAFRIWFDFDGSITPCFKLRKKRDIKKGKNYFYCQMQFECEIRIAETNPFLIKDLVKLCEDLKLKAIVKKKNNWSGIDGICISRTEDVKKFLDQGPITNVLVSGKSNRFEGITKKKICLVAKKIFETQDIFKSKYFKKEFDAIKYRENMNQLLINLVKV